MNATAQTHEMILSGRVEPDAEEWACPRCGRRLLLRWPPRLEKLVLEPGDVTAVHTGAKGGIRAGAIVAAPLPVSTERQWLRDHGIDWDETSG
jgi:hypothetical protein